jgi:hypothetical protein
MLLRPQVRRLRCSGDANADADADADADEQW